MTHYLADMTDVIRATDDDLATVLSWLEAEYEEDGGTGFWCNRQVIEESHRERDDLYVVRRDGEAVSFQVGEYAPSITSTRKDARGRGYATALLHAGIERARRDDVNLLDIECSPRESWEFWQKRGFERYGDMSQWGGITARMVLPKRFDLPPGLPRAIVRVAFFSEDAKYREGIEPLADHVVEGAVLVEGECQLPHRVIAIKDDCKRGDMVVQIEVDGREIYRDKAKYPEATAVGIMNDYRSGAFYIDKVLGA
ncbi:MAG: GNAT family N-acetyltransferase [Proteobacteria bacterium]|nr:GNAT family N-acetyltransferase [Pseudomonadota bacterium]